MKIKSYLTAILAVQFCLLQTACQRSASDVWEDTKTASRHVGKGFSCLAGTTSNSKLIGHPSQFDGPREHDYVPLRDEEIAHQLHLEGYVPQASQTPGEPGSGIPGVDGFAAPSTPEQIRIFQNIYFDTNEHMIRGDKNQQALMAIANYMKSHPNLYLFIEGHCDKRGSAAYNLALGSRRSNMVRNELVREGANPEHIFTISYGKERPLALGDDAESLHQNRRAQFRLFEKSY